MAYSAFGSLPSPDLAAVGTEGAKLASVEDGGFSGMLQPPSAEGLPVYLLPIGSSGERQ